MARRARCRNHGLGASKRFGDVLAVDRIDLQVGEGEFFSLLGPSGSLAFALSFDEIVVTNFTAGAQSTPPIWIFNNLLRPTRRPQVNVVAMFVVLASFVPVYLAQRLTRETGLARPAEEPGAPSAPPAVSAGPG